MEVDKEIKKERERMSVRDTTRQVNRKGGKI